MNDNRITFDEAFQNMIANVQADSVTFEEAVRGVSQISIAVEAHEPSKKGGEMSDITDEVKKKLREIYPEILIRWTQVGGEDWFESPGIALRLDWRYKNHEGGCVMTEELILHHREAVWAFVAMVVKEIRKIERMEAAK